MNKSSLLCTALLTGVLGLASTVPAQASTYYFMNLTSETQSTSSTPGSVSGTLATSSGTVNLSYTGDVAGATQINNQGTNYFTGFNSVYTNSTVSNLPTQNDILTLSEAYTGTNTLKFSSAIVNPILDIVSLGAPGNTVSYNFNAAPTLLSQGSAYWGGCSTCLSVTGDTLSGTEGSGVIEFTGSFSSLSWTTTGGEYWNGFTVGVAGIASTTPPSTTPEPASLALIVPGLGLLALAARRLRSRAA